MYPKQERLDLSIWVKGAVGDAPPSTPPTAKATPLISIKSTGVQNHPAPRVQHKDSTTSWVSFLEKKKMMKIWEMFLPLRPRTPPVDHRVSSRELHNPRTAWQSPRSRCTWTPPRDTTLQSWTSQRIRCPSPRPVNLPPQPNLERRALEQIQSSSWSPQLSWCTRWQQLDFCWQGRAPCPRCSRHRRRCSPPKKPPRSSPAPSTSHPSLPL